ncbi:nuclear transcription factor Y subunit beta [Drosophila takahashii]|uniref:nuclear transcription factor Y subunit beta n=1 Tax=Drosophila takahashii TaxID=29030 RepID=UPI001CF90C98|nr:transcription activator MSS11 [Drosophila takahashii]
MSNGEDVLDNWEEIDEAGLSMTLQTKLQASDPPVHKMKLLQRPQSLQESSQILNSSTSGGGGNGSGNPLPRQITIARKPQPPPAAAAEVDPSAQQQLPVMMVLHKPSNEYDAASYASPISNQTVKILRRPAQAEERRDTNGMRPKQPIKTLKQREQEYAEARLRILGAAKNPEDDKPAAPSSPAVNSSTPSAAAPPSAPPATPPAASSNNNVINNNGSHPAAGMHRSSSAPKMSQVSPMYNNYNSYFQGPHNQPGLNYYYPHNPQQQQQQQQPHYNQRLPPYGGGGAGLGGMPSQAPPQSSPNAQQSWSPVVGGSVSAALLRQQSMQSPQQQQQQQNQQQQLGQHPHPFNDLVLRLPKGPCPNGSIGFQMRR